LTPQQILSELAALGATLSVNGDRLKCSAPQGALGEELSAAIREHKGALVSLLNEVGLAAPPDEPLRTQPDQTRAPLSSNQRRVAMVSRNAPGVPLAIAMRGPLNLDALKYTLDALVTRHPMLRLRIRFDGDEVSQVFAKDELVHLELCPLDHLQGQSQTQALSADMAERSSASLNVETEPPVRFALYRLGAEQHVFWANFSSLAADGHALAIFEQELLTGYDARVSNRIFPWPLLSSTYADFVAWQALGLAPRRERQKAWWRTLHGTTTLPPGLPVDRPRGPLRNYQGRVFRLPIPAGLTEQSRAFAKAKGTTPQVVWLAGIALWLSRLCGQSEVAIANPIDGRNHPSLENVIGPFTNTLLLRFSVKPEDTFEGLVEQVRSRTLSAYENQELPIDEIGLRASPSEGGASSLYESQFSFQQAQALPTTAGGIATQGLDAYSGRANVDLSLWMEDDGHDLKCTVEYASDVFEDTTVSHLTQVLLAQFEQALRRTTLPLSALATLVPDTQPYNDVLRQASPHQLQDDFGHLVPLGVWGTLSGGESPMARVCTDGRYETRSDFEREARPSRASRVSWSYSEPLPQDLAWTETAFARALALTVEDLGEATFFELGGHSLSAIALLADVFRHYGLKLTLADLLEAPTVRAFCNLLRWRLSPPEGVDRLLALPLPILIRPGTDLPPLFFVHDGLGDIYVYRELSQNLPAGWPVYGLQPETNANGEILHTRITEMASAKIQRMRLVQPRGPYYVAGLCAGGVIAFEIAQQLQDSGDSVAFVGILDAADVQAEEHQMLVAKKRWSRFKQALYPPTEGSLSKHLRTAAVSLASKAFNVVAYEAQSRLAHFKVARAVEKMRQAPEVASLGAAQLTFIRLYDIAHAEHNPQGLFRQGRVVLFRATRGDGTEEDAPFVDACVDPLLGWGARVAGAVIAIDVAGGHSTALKQPSVKLLAEQMAEQLELAVRGHGPRTIRSSAKRL